MTNDDVIRNAQYRKNLSIAFFNATNNAMQIIQALNKDFKNVDLGLVQREIRYWRDWLLEEHKAYYAENIANVGLNYDAKETIKKLESAKTIDELRNMWLSLSEDERGNQEIINRTQELKKQLI